MFFFSTKFEGLRSVSREDAFEEVGGAVHHPLVVRGVQILHMCWRLRLELCWLRGSHL